RAE
ncbi:tail length tape measure family protein, partial [Escherichia coli FRIK1997]